MNEWKGEKKGNSCRDATIYTNRKVAGAETRIQLSLVVTAASHDRFTYVYPVIGKSGNTG